MLGRGEGGVAGVFLVALAGWVEPQVLWKFYSGHTNGVSLEQFKHCC